MGRDGGCVVQEQGGTGVLCFVFNVPAVFPVTFSLTVFVAAKCFSKWLNRRLKYILRWILLQNSLSYQLCPDTHIPKTVRVSRSSKSRHCTLVKKPLLNILMLMLLSHSCLLHIVYTYTVALPRTTVKALPFWNTHTNTHSSLPHLSLSRCMTAVHNIPKQYLSFFFFSFLFIICKNVIILWFFKIVKLPSRWYYKEDVSIWSKEDIFFVCVFWTLWPQNWKFMYFFNLKTDHGCYF